MLRAWDMPGGRRETVETADTLEEEFGQSTAVAVRAPRNPGDDPAIYETWC